MNTFILAAIGVFLLAQTVFAGQSQDSQTACQNKRAYIVSLTPGMVQPLQATVPNLKSLGLAVWPIEDAELTARHTGRAMPFVQNSYIEVRKDATAEEIQCAQLIKQQFKAWETFLGLQLPEMQIKAMNKPESSVGSIMIYVARDYAAIYNMKFSSQDGSN